MGIGEVESFDTELEGLVAMVPTLADGDVLAFLPGLQEIRQAGRRASDLTRQLLALSRRQVLTPKLLDLNRAVLETAPAFGPQQDDQTLLLARVRGLPG